MTLPSSAIMLNFHFYCGHFVSCIQRLSPVAVRQLQLEWRSLRIRGSGRIPTAEIDFRVCFSRSQVCVVRVVSFSLRCR
jgi:hypothetical protein